MKYLAVLMLAASSLAAPLSKRQSIVDDLDIPGIVEGELETVGVRTWRPILYKETSLMLNRPLLMRWTSQGLSRTILRL